MAAVAVAAVAEEAKVAVLLVPAAPWQQRQGRGPGTWACGSDSDIDAAIGDWDADCAEMLASLR